MFTQDYLLNYIENAVSNIHYPTQPAGLYEPIAYVMSAGGKRLRPLLTLAACAAVGGDIDSAINQAIGIELFHNFTLLHDDVMDKAQRRRGRDTVHIKWNESTAILSGDAMLTMASQYIGRCEPAVLWPISSLFNTTAMQIYEGQQYDMDFESREDVTIDEYMHMITLKTSVLLAAACRIGAQIAGAGDFELSAFYNFGLNLGIAFQLQDDYLDTFGNPDTFGKNIGGDILNDKKTWLRIMAMSEDREGVIQQLVGHSVAPDEKIRRITTLYRDFELDQRCRTVINEYTDKAIARIESMELTSEDASFFIDLAKNCINRVK